MKPVPDRSFWPLQAAAWRLISDHSNQPTSWRHHGIGMLQLYLPRDCRLHIWHSELVVPGVSLLHNHAWDFHSWVLCGQVTQRRYAFAGRGDDGSTDAIYCHVVITPGPNPVPRRKDAVRLFEMPPEIYEVGADYGMSAHEIHCSKPQDGTVTLVQRTSRREADTVDIYWPDGEFVSAEPKVPDMDLLARMTDIAIQNMREASRQT